MATRTELVGVIRERYQQSDKRGRSAILDEFVAVTGYHRKHAIRLLRTADEARVAPARRTPRRYGEGVREGLIALWEASVGDMAAQSSSISGKYVGWTD